MSRDKCTIEAEIKTTKDKLTKLESELKQVEKWAIPSGIAVGMIFEIHYGLSTNKFLVCSTHSEWGLTIIGGYSSGCWSSELGAVKTSKGNYDTTSEDVKRFLINHQAKYLGYFSDLYQEKKSE